MSTRRTQLPLTAQERLHLREAGLQPSDLAHMTGPALVMATDEAIGDARADELTAIAALQSLPSVTAGVARVLTGLGYRSRSDLAGMTADELYVEVARRLGGDHPSWHDICSAVLYAVAGGRNESMLASAFWYGERKARNFEPVVLRWRDMHGIEAVVPAPLSASVEVPSARIKARLVSAGLDEHGAVISPLGARDVSWLHGDEFPGDGGHAVLLVGHRVWSGGHGAFLRLDTVKAGDEVRLRTGRDTHRFVVSWTRTFDDGAVPWAELLTAPQVPTVTLVSAAPVPMSHTRFAVGASIPG